MFRLLGFDVKVQSGFLVFMALIVFINPGPFGFWLAGALTVLTLVHELGHAMAARRTGAHAEISLTFMAGYASYQPTRELSRLEQAWISFAGPFVHISLSVAVLVAMGVNPLDRESVIQSEAAQAIWWAGPAIGALNLIPVLPLDGGNIATVGLDRLVPGRARKYMLYFSITATLAFAVTMVLSGRQAFVFFVLFLLITQFQMLQSAKPRPTAPSPWHLAAASLDAGNEAKARRTLVAALSHPQPKAVRRDKLELTPAHANDLIELLPNPLPHGDPYNESVLANLLLLTERYEEAAHYAADAYERRPHTACATFVARAAAALGDEAIAIGWLHSAAEISTAPAELAAVIDRAPELEALRDHPDIVVIRSRLSPSA